MLTQILLLILLASPNDFHKHIDLGPQLIAPALGTRRFSGNLGQLVGFQTGDILVRQQSSQLVEQHCFHTEDGDVVDECI